MPGFRLSPRATPYLFLAPALFILGLTVFWPALQAFYYSFTRYDLISPPVWIGWENFERLWGDETFWKTLRNTILYLVCVVPLLMFLPLGLAILVNQKLRGMNGFRLAYYTPVVISMVVAGIAWRWLYAENGLLNQIASGILGQGPSGGGSAGLSGGFWGWASELLPIPWLTSPDFALFSVMAVTVWKGLGYYMVVYLAGLQGISPELYEAAAIDGSDGLAKHWDITLPLMRPYLILVGIISSISATKVFEEVYIMTQGGPLNSSKTIVYYVYEQAFGQLEISYGCTIGLVLFLIVLVPSLLRLAVGGEEAMGQG